MNVRSVARSLDERRYLPALVVRPSARGILAAKSGTLDARPRNERRREMGDVLAGVRTLSCAHCGEHFMAMPNVSDDDVVLLGLLAAHLTLRHPDHFTLRGDPRLTEVLPHFLDARRGVVDA